MSRALFQAVLIVSAIAVWLRADPAWAPFHFVVIEEVFFGSEECPNAQYVVLRTLTRGQTEVNGQRVTTQNADGSPAEDFGAFPARLPNSDADVAMLIGTADAEGYFGIPFDAVVTGQLIFPDGRLCFGEFIGAPVDCIAYGSFTGDNDDHGQPAAQPVLNMALVRMSETDNNADDFELGSPMPENNDGQVGAPGQCPGVEPTPIPTTPTVEPTPSPTSPPTGCGGDCNGDRMVGINEVLVGVNILLGSLPLSNCVAFDLNNDGMVAINEVVGAVLNALNGCPDLGVLGTRRFSLNPESKLVSVIAPGFAPETPEFTGFLELTAGAVDPETGIASFDITDSSEFLSVDISFVGITICIRPVREAFPIENAGLIFCNGGFPVGFALTQDHNIGVVDTCTAPADGGTGAGLEEGMPCGSDEECASGQCFSEEDCLAADIGDVDDGFPRVEGPDDPHPGVCNGPIVPELLPGDSGPGAVFFGPDPVTNLTQALPVEIITETALPCGDEENALGIGTILPIGMTTGTAIGELLDFNNQEGIMLLDEQMGENFVCERWSEEDSPGTLVFSAPLIDPPGAQGSAPSDLVSSFVWDD